jgi:hypothetical protein
MRHVLDGSWSHLWPTMSGAKESPKGKAPPRMADDNAPVPRDFAPACLKAHAPADQPAQDMERRQASVCQASHHQRQTAHSNKSASRGGNSLLHLRTAKKSADSVVNVFWRSATRATEEFDSCSSPLAHKDPPESRRTRMRCYRPYALSDDRATFATKSATTYRT